MSYLASFQEAIYVVTFWSWSIYDTFFFFFPFSHSSGKDIVFLYIIALQLLLQNSFWSWLFETGPMCYSQCSQVTLSSEGLSRQVLHEASLIVPKNLCCTIISIFTWGYIEVSFNLPFRDSLISSSVTILRNKMTIYSALYLQEAS